MFRNGVSITAILVFIIGIMGLLGLAFTHFSGTVHQQHAYNNQRRAMIELIRIKADDLLQQLESMEKKMGLALQAEAPFRTAFKQQDQEKMRKILDNEFHRFFSTTGKIRLEKLAVYDRDFNLFAEQASEHSMLSDAEIGCNSVLVKARKRQAAERLKMISELCQLQQRAYHTTIIPIGGIRLKGYLFITTDPVYNLSPIEKALAMPIAVRLPGQKISYQSKNWQAMDNHEVITAVYQLTSNNSEPTLEVLAKDRVVPLFKNIPNPSFFVMIIVSLFTLLYIAIATVILRRTTINPLKKLTMYLNDITEDKARLGEKISVGGIREIQALCKSFNIMSEELGGLYQSLENMAFTDQITNLPNRNFFQSHLKEVINYHKSIEHPFALLIMDMDKFKAINDALGHQTGDMLLNDVGQRLETLLRGSDIVARLGGDEFAAIITLKREREHQNSVSVMVHKIIDVMAEPFMIDGHTLLVGMSIGIALFPEHSVNNNDLMRKADVAMYHAKKTRAGFSFYSDKHDEYSVRYLLLSKDLMTAIEKDQLQLYYQPKVDAKKGSLTGSEALIRWQHPELGFVPPSEFIPIAEQSGQIRKLTSWIINKAIEQCSLWRAEGYDLGVSINLSAINLHDQSLVDEIHQAMRTYNMKPQYLTLEITESSIMGDPEQSVKVMRQHREQGFNLSIDDFGTGYSSLSYVKKFPVNELKIDQSFVRNLINDPNDEAIVSSVIVLSHSMGFKVVAEGVEDQATLAKLADMQCDVIQGYYIAKPMPYSDFIPWLHEYVHHTKR